MTTALRLFPQGAFSLVPDFKALRIAVRRDASLSLPARRVFEDVCDLAERTGSCNAGDRHFAGIYGTTTRTVRRWFEQLRDAGYLASDGETKARKLVPTDPALRTQSDLRDRTQDVLNGVDLGHAASGDLGHSVTDTKSIYVFPERGEEEPAPETDPKDEHRLDEQRPAGAPTLADVLARASVAGVTPEVAEQFFWHYEAAAWEINGQPIRNWVAKLMQWRLTQPGFDRSRPAGRAAAFDAAQPVLDDRMPAVLAAHPRLRREHFYQAGRDPRSGMARWQLRPEHTALVA